MDNFCATAGTMSPEIAVDREQVLRRLGNVKKPEKFAPYIDRALEEARNLWQPCICWARYRMAGIGADGRVTVSPCPEDGAANSERSVLHIGARANLLEGAEECFVAVATVGKEICERLADMEREGDPVSLYLLDVVGVLALNATHEHFRRLVEAYAAVRDWGVGPVMQPGSLDGWQLEGQIDLLRLVAVEEIGVSLNEQFMMEPFKSNSSLVGVGPDYGKAASECLCEDCGRLNCPWRRTRTYGDA